MTLVEAIFVAAKRPAAKRGQAERPRAERLEARGIGARPLPLDEVKDTDYEALLTITLAFGLRRGEALVLMWAGFDAESANLEVTHSVKRVRDLQ